LKRSKESVGDPTSFVLGLDIGASSIGWAVLKTDSNDGAQSVVACGTRVFEAGVEGSIETGRDTPRGVARRDARLSRRQTARRVQRRRNVYRALMSAGLLPQLSSLDHSGVDGAIREIDTHLRRQWIAEGDHKGQLVFPYQIRAAAAQGPLDPQSLGRAIYHLAQRRGFLSNRRVDKKDEKIGVVKEGIASLAADMTAGNHNTLGQFFASIDPRDIRIRNRYTHRTMYQHEFDAIAAANTQVPAETWAAIRKCIFFQRKLKSSAHLIGRCTCIPKARRIPMWHPLFQRYRILEKISNLRVRDPSDGIWHPLPDQERAVLLSYLTENEKATPAKIKTLLKLKGRELSIETEGSSAMIGNRTGCAMRAVFGERWNGMSPDEQMKALLDVHSFEKDESLKRRGERRWNLSPESAAKLASTRLEPSYASFSAKAIVLLLPHLERGLNSRQAIDIVFPSRFAVAESCDRLPPVSEILPDLRNPAVGRALTEVRSLVNQIIGRWGKPTTVRLELARDLKKSRDQRDLISKENRSQERIREQAAVRVVQEAGIPRPSRGDIEKCLLAEECDFTCPYTGKKFGMRDLFGPHPTVDVEHIIPFSRSLDDSFVNKTLCVADENRQVKRNKTPWEAYGRMGERFSEIMGRVDKFRGGRASAKRERFLMKDVGEELLSEFASRQLNDTRFASTMAAKFVALLYGGVNDASGTKCVQASTGGVTARLRRAWRMGYALHDEGEKNRDDHRNHALDAIAIALSSPGIVKRMADAARRGAEAGRDGKLLEFSEPWSGFLEDVKAAISTAVVSHRPDRRLAGKLHEDTYYSRPLRVGNEWVHRVRKPTANSEAAQSTKTRGQVRHTRTEGDRRPVALETKTGTRWVAPRSNHHMAIYEVVGKSKTSWEAETVTRLEAHRRKRCGEPIIRTDRGDGSRFLFSLRSGDTIRLRDQDGLAMLAVVRSASGKTIEAIGINDARSTKDVRDGGVSMGRLRLSLTKMRARGVEKVDVNPIGVLTVARD